MDNIRLKELFSMIGIELFGVAGVDVSDNLKEILNIRLKNDFTTELEEQDLQKRVDVKKTMKNAKSIIVCAFPYYVRNIEESNISKYCYGLDYHIVIENKLKKLCDLIHSEVDDFEYMFFSDTGPLVDRYLAYLSGIGYFGINNSIITDRYGSYVFIGYIINNFKFNVDKPMEKTCLKCGKCIENCPGNVISENYMANFKKCISYVTQKRGELTREEKIVLKKGNKIFGCDICQEVCPHNKGIETTNINEFKDDIVVNIDKNELLKLSNKEFKDKYGNRAFSWRGKKVLIRNLE